MRNISVLEKLYENKYRREEKIDIAKMKLEMKRKPIDRTSEHRKMVKI